MEVDERAVKGAKRSYKTGNKAYSWYSRLSKARKILLWLLATLAVLAIALGVGLGVGLRGPDGDNDNDNDNDRDN